MRILLSAYSCEPHRGSEPGLGWNTAVELGRNHDVWVVTKERHRQAIEQELARQPQPRVHFVYHDLPVPLCWMSRYGWLGQLHYYLWQYSVYPTARRLCREIGFEVAHHVTFGRFWSPSLFSWLPVPFVWGGVGGGEVVSPPMRSTLKWPARIIEWVKERMFELYRFDPLVRLTARRSVLILANNANTAGRLAAITPSRVDYMDTAVVDRKTVTLIDGLAEPAPRNPDDPVCFATLTRLEAWKGVHLGLHAFKRLADGRARYLIVGAGPERRSLEQLARQLGIASQVEFLGNPSRAEWMRLLKQCHALVHPPLASPFNTIVLEAMLCARPIICFKTDYLVEKLGSDTSYFVDCASPEEAVSGLAEAMRQVASQPTEARERGLRGRERALQLFTWDARIERLERFLREAAS